MHFVYPDVGEGTIGQISGKSYPWRGTWHTLMNIRNGNHPPPCLEVMAVIQINILNLLLCLPRLTVTWFRNSSPWAGGTAQWWSICPAYSGSRVISPALWEKKERKEGSERERKRVHSTLLLWTSRRFNSENKINLKYHKDTIYVYVKVKACVTKSHFNLRGSTSLFFQLYKSWTTAMNYSN